MKLSATIAGVIGITAVAGTLVFNTDTAQKVKENIEELRAKIVAFAENDKALVTKYNDLKISAETKIADLETKKSELETEITKLKNNATADASEIERLQGEVTKANTAITDLETLSNSAVEEANGYEPTKPDSLPGLEVKLATVAPYFYAERAQVTIRLKEDIDIALSSKGNIKIEFIDADGNPVETKSKIYSGYLNDSQGNKYGKGAEFWNKNYSNQLVAGTTYSTTLNKANIAKVIVTVTNNEGVVQTITKEK